MQPFNKSQLVKFVYAYVDLFKKLFPLFLFFLLFPFVIGIITGKFQNPGSFDFFKLFSENKEFSQLNDPSILQILLVLALNFFVGIVIYLAIRKLNLFMKNVFNDSPFCKENGEFLKYIGVIAVGLTVLIHIIKGISAAFIVGGLIKGATILVAVIGVLSVVFNPYLILGMFVFLVGELIYYAAELKQESDLTV